MKKNKQNIIWAIMLMTGVVFAQDKQLKKANKLFKDLAYADAKKVYVDLAEKGIEDADLFRKLGDVHYFNGQYKEAANWYEKAFRLDNNPADSYNFRYGQALKSSGEVAKADLYLNKFFRNKAVDYTSTRDYLAALTKNSGNFSISPVSFNTKYSDYPAYYRNGELYVITADQSNKTNPWNKEPASDIYIGDRLKPIGKPINTKYNEGSLVITKNGQTMYFTRNDYVKRKLGKDSQDVTRLKLFRTDKVNGQWSEPEALPFNSSEYSVGHPALSADETKLYFVSDMPSGKGGTDLYESEIYDDNTYGIPTNLTAFNTIGNEMFPFVDENDNFYFSSNGHPNIGGLDVFYAQTNEDGTFESPKNIGAPINSTYDDFAFVLDQNQGYFASNRDDQNDQIYAVNQLEPLLKCEVNFEGVVIDKRSGQPIPNSDVVFINGYLKEVGRVSTDEQGRYKFTDEECGNVTIIRANQSNYFANEVVVSTEEGGILNTTIPLDLRRMAIVEETSGSKTDLGLLLNPIYFDLDKSKIRSDAKIELEKIVSIMNQYPTLEIDVRSHTDSRAEDSYNLALSERRVQSTINYLVKRGISRSRLTGRGYGESKLVNQCSNGVKCSETQHQRNRRSEFVITKR